MNNKDHTFLSRWLNNQLSEEELQHFKASADYPLYLKIIEETDKLQAPPFDLDSAFSSLKIQRDLKNNRPKKWRYLNIAASIILLLGVFTYFKFFSVTTYSTGYGEQITHTLPDGSKVILNSKSSLNYNSYNWENHRNLTLEGEAFFDVETGNTFTVNTALGNISVLGTEFNVNATDNYFNVVCYEGKVKVEDNTNASTHILTPALGYQHIKNHNAIALNVNTSEPEWLHQHTSFKSTPIKHVFTTLEKHYNLKFTYNTFDDTILFTGTFPNNNQHIALETVLKSVNLNYTINGNRVILED
ncbi:MAG: FecR family protein [Flavobacteriaceae bacterium]